MTYEFQEGKVELIGEELLPSPYRMYVLEDAEIATQKRDFETAIKIYDRVARDNSLIDVLTAWEKGLISEKVTEAELLRTNHAYQTAYAYFREYSLLQYLGRTPDANKVLGRMKAIYPDGKEGSEFIDIASFLKSQLESGLDFHEACAATNGYLAKKYILGTVNDFIYTHLITWDEVIISPGELLCPEMETDILPAPTPTSP